MHNQIFGILNNRKLAVFLCLFRGFIGIKTFISIVTKKLNVKRATITT